MNLLSEEDICSLRVPLAILRDHRDEVLTTWWTMYAEHFGDRRALSKPAFFDIHARDIDAVVITFLSGRLEEFAAQVRAIGSELADRLVPFAEVVASVHLFEQSTAGYFADSVPDPALASMTFDKLSHCRMILLAEAYYVGREADMGARLRTLENEADRLAGEPSRRASFRGLVGKCDAMREVYRLIAGVGNGTGTVMIVGESGTGKELVARALHECSPVAHGPFVPINCAALPAELIESELFGHRRGAYTGAHTEYAGLVRAADGGTLFFDEITEMPAAAQAKLLRVIEERAVRPVGSTQEVPVDVRFIASTNRDPEKAVEAGLLRRDLWHRINVHRITLPPLRERIPDIALLCEYFLEVFAKRGLRRAREFEPDAIRALRVYPWPGNVRELRNSIQHALEIGHGTVVTRDSLPPHVLDERATPKWQAVPPVGDEIPSLKEAERQLVARAMDATGGNKMQAARLLGVSRHGLYNKLRRFDLR